MKLIYADRLKDEVVKWLSTDDGIEQRDLVGIDDIAVSVIQTIDEQPTAYDVDKVVEEIEAFGGCTECKEKGTNKRFYYGQGCKACVFGKIVDIVKRGGGE